MARQPLPLKLSGEGVFSREVIKDESGVSSTPGWERVVESSGGRAGG